MVMMRPIGHKVFTVRVQSILPAFTYLCDIIEERPVGASACVAGQGERHYHSISATEGALLSSLGW